MTLVEALDIYELVLSGSRDDLEELRTVYSEEEVRRACRVGYLWFRRRIKQPNPELEVIAADFTNLVRKIKFDGCVGYHAPLIVSRYEVKRP